MLFLCVCNDRFTQLVLYLNNRDTKSCSTAILCENTRFK